MNTFTNIQSPLGPERKEEDLGYRMRAEEGLDDRQEINKRTELKNSILYQKVKNFHQILYVYVSLQHQYQYLYLDPGRFLVLDLI